MFLYKRSEMRVKLDGLRSHLAVSLNHALVACGEGAYPEPRLKRLIGVEQYIRSGSIPTGDAAFTHEAVMAFLLCASLAPIRPPISGTGVVVPVRLDRHVSVFGHIARFQQYTLVRFQSLKLRVYKARRIQVVLLDYIGDACPVSEVLVHSVIIRTARSLDVLPEGIEHQERRAT